MTTQEKYKRTFKLVNEDVMDSCITEIVEAYENYHEPMVLIMEKEEARSAAQHRLKWMWMGQIAKQTIGTGKGYSKNGWNRFFKDKYIKSILIEQSEAYIDFFKNIEEIKLRNPDNKFLILRMIDLIKTEWLNVKNMSHFLDCIYHYATMDLGCVLTIPDDLKWAHEVKDAA